MSDHDFMPIDGWDHLELWVGNAKQAAYFYENAYGFMRTAYAGPETGVRDRASYVLEQGEIRFVITSGLRADSEICKWAGREGDSVRGELGRWLLSPGGGLLTREADMLFFDSIGDLGG